MIRPRLALATFATIALGAAGADAAEPLAALLAQSATVPRGPGFYLHLFKFVPVLLLFLMWAWTTSWIEADSHDPTNLQQDYTTWPIVAFFAGLVAFALFWVIPIYAVSLILLLLAYFGPLIAYIGIRNQEYEYEGQVLTAYHLGNVANGIMRSMGMKGPFNRKFKKEEAGPPIQFAVDKATAGKVKPDLVAEAEQSEAYVSAQMMVYDAVVRRATEIQMEPGPEQMAVRYRIDGVPHTAEPFDRATGDAVLNIFKVYSAMDLNERRKPQDGTLNAKVEGREINFRVATSGSKAGEKLAMRIIDTANAIVKIDEVGLRTKLVAELKGLINHPEGLVLFSGPASSGKTTTLYCAMREIDRFQKSIISLEDPIESKIDNVSQKELNAKTGETFASLLPTLIREEPDILVVSEVRDPETAAILAQAAQKRMIFSTVVADDTVTALFRLLDLGVEPATLASVLTAIVGQRLARVLCDTCKEPYKPKPEFLKKANLPADKVEFFYRPPTVPREEVCPQCGGTAYVGRTGIFEMLVITDSMRDLIRENPTVNAIKAEARKNGMIYLHEDGLRQVFQGKTSIDELRRVVETKPTPQAKTT